MQRSRIKLSLTRVALASAAVVSSLLAAGLSAAQSQGTLIEGVPTDTLPALLQPRGKIEVIVKLADAPLAAMQGENAKQRGMAMSADRSRAYLEDLRGKQDVVMGQIRSLGGEETARTSKALNAIAVRIDAAQLRALRELSGVVSVRPVRDYQLDLTDTVPYIGASTAQSLGKDGSGIRVAVLDSGIDYTHRNLGGSGNLADYQAAFAARESAFAGFPTAKVVGGYDFVGETWPNGPRTEDPNPIDQEGHGTHVADIIAGRSADGMHKGVAPGAQLLAVKVCSAVASSCNGVALLKGIEFALDPNGDGDFSDAVDVINMSLGASYGQKEDDLSEASANAVRLGVVVVASAGNSADRPYILGSPSSTPEVISVAQTQVPSAKSIPLLITAPAAIAGTYGNTATLDWAPIGSGFSGAVAYVGRGCNADAYLSNPAGKVALIDRGACPISEKVARASAAGATGVLVGLVAPGDAVPFSNAGNCPATPNGTCRGALVITQAVSSAIKANLATANVAVSEANAIALAGSMVASSSRGPSYSYNAIKPDIGAPGASISAIAGTGTGTEPFGGTSGAAPMVAGAAAILLQAFPGRSPFEIKSLLMNTAETQIYTNPALLPGVLAPITRIGGGEVRVDRALRSSIAAYDARSGAGSLSFGYVAATKNDRLSRKVTVANYGTSTRTLQIGSSFRYANDATSGAVTVSTPGFISVRPGDTRSFEVELKIDAAKLPAWTVNGGSQGGNGPLLQSVEFDGYITLSDAVGSISLPWQVMPHKAAKLELSDDDLELGRTLRIRNEGATAGRVDVFDLTGTSKRIPRNQLPQPGDNFAIVDLRAVGVRLVQFASNQFAVQFGIRTNGNRAHPNYPAQFQIEVDSDGNGTPDYVVFNGESGGFGVSGQNVTNVFTVATGTTQAFFFTDADLNSGNAILTAPLAALGLTPSSTLRFNVYAVDNYFTGAETDSITGMTYTFGQPRYVLASTIPAAGVPVGGSATLTATAGPAGSNDASPSHSGFLLLYRDAQPGKEGATLKIER